MHLLHKTAQRGYPQDAGLFDGADIGGQAVRRRISTNPPKVKKLIVAGSGTRE